MAWYDEAIFYHIYPLGLLGAPFENDNSKPVHRLIQLNPWISHIKTLGCNAIYLGPLFQSGSHGYDTTDYKQVDSRLGTNKDLTDFVKNCHKEGIRVVLDGVFNHTGRDFFALKDIRKHRENSPYKDWYCNVNFSGNNSYQDGFSYENWGGHDLLAKLNSWNPAVVDYICQVMKFWVEEFDIDGIRLDAADVMDFNYIRALRSTANTLKDDFWLMGEVIHGDYTRWVNPNMLHAVTNYALHKALYSGHNDHNYFEIAHNVKRLYDMGGQDPLGLRLYNFVDNHDVDRIIDKLNNKDHMIPLHILLYTLPGIPSIYYGSEFAIHGRKEGGCDRPLRPALKLEDFSKDLSKNLYTKLIAALGKIRQDHSCLSYGRYEEILLTNRQYGFIRRLDDSFVIILVNNDETEAHFTISSYGCQTYQGLLSKQTYTSEGDQLRITLNPCGGDILLPS